jgi:hypothetical protein
VSRRKEVEIQVLHLPVRFSQVPQFSGQVTQVLEIFTYYPPVQILTQRLGKYIDASTKGM